MKLRRVRKNTSMKFFDKRKNESRKPKIVMISRVTRYPKGKRPQTTNYRVD